MSGLLAIEDSGRGEALDFAGDVREVVDALEIERFAVIGVSAGGPYALAVARELEASTSFLDDRERAGPATDPELGG
jgi:pimeloyl-ACP methyl ester carboxylesterase